MEIISREDYIRRTQEPLDHGMLIYPNGISNAEKRRIDIRYSERTLNNAQEADKAALEYDRLFALGEIRPPERREILIARANGHPDNESVQACRRLCEKKGIDWTKGI